MFALFSWEQYVGSKQKKKNVFGREHMHVVKSVND